jgi:hypothetical protein
MDEALVKADPVGCVPKVAVEVITDPPSSVIVVA